MLQETGTLLHWKFPLNAEAPSPRAPAISFKTSSGESTGADLLIAKAGIRESLSGHVFVTAQKDGPKNNPRVSTARTSI